MNPLLSALRYWWPAALWMSLIFYGSTDALSAPNTSRFLGPLLEWLFPGIDPSITENLRFLIRKCGHLTEYAILALLCLRGFQRPTSLLFHPEPQFLNRAWFLTSFYAVTDEFHQSLVPSRYGSITDVLIDSIGALLGLMAFKWVANRFHQRKENL